jgi:hypothetical protein
VRDGNTALEAAWAARTKNGLSQDLRALEETAHFTRFDLECRSKTCSGEVEWPSTAQARASIPLLLHNQYSINSGVRYLFPNSPGPGPCRVSVLFEPQDLKVEPTYE